LGGLICTNCGTENLAGAKFCMECASPLAAGCPSCGFVNPAGAKFCSECATRLTAPAAPAAAGGTPARRSDATATSVGPRGSSPDAGAQRRVVSVLFADLVGFTPFAEERDAEDVRDTLTRYFDLASDVIARYGGIVEKFIGDAVMAVWGAPTAQEDDAERAVRAGLDLVDAVRALGPGIQARAGVLTGEAAVTIGATNQGMVTGDLVNTAARLQSVAPPGAVLVGEATQRAAAGAIVFEEAGEQNLKGKTLPVPAWRALRVVAQRRGRGRSDSLEAPFVGRDEEMRLLKDLFHATNREGRPRLVSVIGPAGVGKSRLAWEFLKYIDGLVETIFWHDGRSPAYGDGITFWALGEMVRSRAGLAESDDEPTTRAHVASILAAHVPDEAERAWIERAMLALLGFESGVDPQQLFAAWRTFFERLATTSPVVMVFEDLHFADAGTLDFIDHVLEWTRTAPITIITLARPELLERRPTWGAGQRSFTSIHLDPLPEAAIRKLLAGLVPGLPGPATDAIVARADGIPLYAVETVRMLVSQGRLVPDGDVYRPVGEIDAIAVPETLTALIAARLDGLDAADRSLIEDAAVLGQSFTPAALAAISGTDSADVEPRLRALVRRELLVLEADPRSPERGQYVFVQALIREVAYNTLSKKDRKTRHLAAARYFEALGSDELAGGLAGHYLAAQRLAGDGPEADALAAQARVALRGAAERAAALGSHAQALTFIDLALAVTSDVGERADLHERAVESAKHGIDADVVERHAAGALEARRAGGDRVAIAAAAEVHGTVVAGWRSDPQRGLDLLLPAAEEFSDLADTEAGMRLLIAVARQYVRLQQYGPAMERIERLLPIAERLGLVEAIASGLSLKATVLHGTGRPQEAWVLVDGAFRLATAHQLHEREMYLRTGRTFHAQYMDPAEGLELAREGQENARRLGSRAYTFLMVGNGVSCAFRTGEWDWADAQLDEWLGEERLLSGGVVELLVDHAILAAVRGRDASADMARVVADLEGITDPQYVSYEHMARAWIALSEGRLPEAADRAETASDATSDFQMIALPVAARAGLWAGDPSRVRQVVARLDASIQLGRAFDADRVTARAGLAALEGRTTEAASAYREALRAWRGLKLAWDEALTIIDMATVLGPADPEVRAAADVARATLRRLEASPYLDRLEAAMSGPPAAGARRVAPAAADRVPDEASAPV
jgi:class 3 adenylate cyclase/tetratricopeptide (TPR) repeat protein